MGKQSDGSSFILSYLNTHGIIDKDLAVSSSPKKTSLKNKTSGKRNGRVVLDLHGLKQREAELKLNDEIEHCLHHGIGSLLVIHGHGVHSLATIGPVLKTMVREVLDFKMRLGEIHSYKNAMAKDGGEGATLVLIR